MGNFHNRHVTVACHTIIVELTQFPFLSKLRHLERIDETQIKVRYNFGKSPHLLPKDKREIIDLGEFPMEMENPTNIPTEK